MDNYVLGDTGGHANQLYNRLALIGADVELGILPPNVRIIHLGDLIHKGPSSKSILTVVDRFIRNNPKQWVQLLGNHEFQHIEGSPYFWSCECDINDIGIINDWYEEGLATATFGLTTNCQFILDSSYYIETDNVLFSHAGLTHRWWETMEKPITAVEASRILNSLPVDVITVAGEMLGMNAPAGPVWATGNNEVFNSWISSTDKMPFTQLHGHTSSFNWKRRAWWRTDAGIEQFKTATRLHPETRSVVTELNGNALIGIDPGFSKMADLDIQPAVFFIS